MEGLRPLGDHLSARDHRRATGKFLLTNNGLRRKLRQGFG
jgi:hypothetical protein